MQVWQLGYYEIVRPLGEGGMAQVYLARDRRLGRDVAVKVLDEQLAERQSFRERFLREARVAAALDHPNIVPIFDFGESDGHPYLVMPYVSGGSLQDQLSRTPMPPAAAAAFGTQMADALDYAHERGVVHRDVKPANMLQHADGRLMLADFGLAKILDGSAPRRPGRPDAGTPEYMAPEQIDGRTDERSDIYGLGVVLYLLLTGKLPFGGATSNAVMEGHLYRLAELPRNLNPAVTPAMQDVVLRALAKDPADRFQRASEFGAALMGALVAGDVEPPPFAVVASNPNSRPTFSPLPPLYTPAHTPRDAVSAAHAWDPSRREDMPPQTSQPQRISRSPSAISAYPTLQTRSYGPARDAARADVASLVEQPSGVIQRPSLPSPLRASRPSQPITLPPSLTAPEAATQRGSEVHQDALPREDARGSRLWTWIILGLGVVLVGLIALFVILVQGHM